MKKLSTGARTYIATLSLGAALTVIFFATHHTDVAGHPYLAEVVGFGVMFLLAELFPVPLPGGGSYSVSFVIVLAAIITRQGAELAAIVAAFGALDFRRGRDSRAPLARKVFNGSELVLATAAAGIVYSAMVRAIGLEQQNMLSSARIFVPIFAASLTYFLINTSLVAAMLSLANGGNPLRIWRDQFSSFLGGYFAFALLGYLLGALNIVMGPAAVLFLLVPLLVARNAFQASVKMSASYEATVRSLITAIEVKDAYTRGHAERVARLSEMVSKELGLAEDRVRVVRFAALMHDVGKLGVETKILQKPGKLTAEEYEHMKIHPIRGHEIVGEIDFLAEAVGAVRHHHERLDGNGYPDGLKGDEIPLFARIIMVADAFDSMTSTRVYRKSKTFDEALSEIDRCKGSQFDPVCLGALQRAIERHGWEAFPETGEHEEVGKGAHAAGL